MAKIEKIFLRVPSELKERWLDVVADTRTPQNQVGTAIVEWFISLDRYQRADVLAGHFTPVHPSPTPAAQGEPSSPPRVGPSPASKRLGPSAAGKRIK